MTAFLDEHDLLAPPALDALPVADPDWLRAYPLARSSGLGSRVSTSKPMARDAEVEWREFCSVFGSGRTEADR